ncbi:MAG: hypothetical protein GF353_22150 [Candidatus Lokiarchaeota archaeon]|nr:hypothetical protein [Candidatus Lokiarchaeota archaeon]
MEKNNFINSAISRIYRNLEILNFSEETNYDLVSELFYSCETLKLFNSANADSMLISLVNFLFPQPIVDKIARNKSRLHKRSKFEHIQLCKTTEEIIYPAIIGKI